jgi:hypothetical protein
VEINSINDALYAFNRIEDQRDKIRTAYESKDAKLKAAREQIETYLLQQLKEMGLSSFEVPGEGVAHVKTKRRFGCADWSLFWDWLIQNKCPEMLQKRLLDTAMQKYLDDNGQLPPAISTEAWLTIAVTKR